MGTEKRLCSICAWRESCQKRFMVATDAVGNVHCPDYCRDVAIRDHQLNEAGNSCKQNQL